MEESHTGELKNSKNTGLSFLVEFGWERGREGEDLPLGGPGGTHATGGHDLHPYRAELWRGRVMGPPGQPQVLPRRKIKNRNLRKISEFSDNFQFRAKTGHLKF